MALVHGGQRIVTDGLVLCLDAGNQKSFSPKWSTGWSGSFGTAANSFDGNLTTVTGGVGGTFSATYTFAGGLPVFGSARVYVTLGASQVQVGSRTNVILVNGNDITQKMKDAGLYLVGGWIDVTTEVGSVFNTIVLNGTGSSTNPGIAAIEVNGRILIDSPGTTWTDLSGNGNNGSLGIGTQAPTYSSANGGSLVFDGVDDYVQSNSESVSIGTQVTVTAWVRHNTLPTKTQRYLTLTGEVAVIRHYGASSAKQLHFYIKTSGTLKVNLQVNNALEVNTWYYVVGTWNGTIMRLYKNAVEIGTSTPGGILDGGNLGYGVSSNPETMDGNISQVSIYNRALTAQEVQQNFNALRGRYGI